ncbi:MAG TPA: UDP-glucose/GDP-mannose dehydrogenase family protein [Devosiaceae bacterium]|nr:UDP-glucose/GDP-mannose dehydrogenase family protein [Devosiaceae bacterium]
MRLAIVGTGYVGLVSGVCLAAAGHDVTCVDVNLQIVSRLNAGEPTIYERGLPEMLAGVIAAGRFRATQDLSTGLDGVDLVLIAVGTPSESGVIDLTYVRAAAREIGSYIGRNERHISVVVKSTVVPGTTDTVVRGEIEAASGKALGAFGLGMNPEFLREGEAVSDFAEPDRIVLGHEDELTLARLEELYASWAVDKLRVNTRTAEMIKYANNALLATQISAVNEIANLAAALGGVDVLDVMQGVHLDKRWNPIVETGGRAAPRILTYLMPGCGFGGSCFPKDVQALRSQGEQQGLSMRMLNAVLDVNEAQPRQVTDIIAREIGDLAGRRVLVLGLAFKPGTDDVRESASLKIIEALVGAGARVTAHDPIATVHFRRAAGAMAEAVAFVDAWEPEIAAAEVVIVATRWPDYAGITGMNLSGKTLFDARRMFRPDNVGGAQYLTIGRRIAA